jgi:hypothetical protein
MARESKTFEVFDYHVQDEEMRLQGNLYTLNILKSYLASMGVETAFTQNGGKIGLDIRSGAKPDYVKQLIEEWAD